MGSIPFFQCSLNFQFHQKREITRNHQQKCRKIAIDHPSQAVFCPFEAANLPEVDDIGGGMPLYKDLGSEDWTLMTLCLAAQSFDFFFRKKGWNSMGDQLWGYIYIHIYIYINVLIHTQICILINNMTIDLISYLI